jgi:hypothetical protein
VLRAKRSFFVQATIVGALLTVGAIAVAVYLFTSGSVFGYGLNDQTPSNVLLIWLIIDLVVLIGVAIAGIVIAIRHLLQLGTAGDQMLILMPTGFVKRQGTADNQTTAVEYQQVAAMRTSIERGGVYLLIQPRGGAKVAKVELDSRFGKPKAIAQHITGTWAQVAAQARAVQG